MKCSLCDHHSTNFLLKADLREYWSCPKCFLIFVPPQFFISEEEEVRRYLEHDNSVENEGYVKMFQQKINVLKKMCPKINTVLDYGCGYAPVLKSLLEREGYQVDGYDPNFFPQEEPHKTYDLVISTETFEHIKNPKKELARLIPKISNKGYLAIMTRFYPINNFTICLATFRKWYYKRDPTHVVFYGQKTFSWMADKYEFHLCHNNQFDFIIFKKK